MISFELPPVRILLRRKSLFFGSMEQFTFRYSNLSLKLYQHIVIYCIILWT
jgi:hypothetical protein